MRLVELERMIELRKQGKLDFEIAAEMGVAYGHVRRVFGAARTLGIKVPDSPWRVKA